MTDELTPEMRRALWVCGFGVRAYSNRWRSIDCPDVFVNGRSIRALIKRGLLHYFMSTCGGVEVQSRLQLTAEGEAMFEALRAAGYDSARGKVW